MLLVKKGEKKRVGKSLTTHPLCNSRYYESLRVVDDENFRIRVNVAETQHLGESVDTHIAIIIDNNRNDMRSHYTVKWSCSIVNNTHRTLSGFFTKKYCATESMVGRNGVKTFMNLGAEYARKRGCSWQSNKTGDWASALSLAHFFCLRWIYLALENSVFLPNVAWESTIFWIIS